MNRTGLIIALAVGTIVGLIFGVDPQLDLQVAHIFFDPHADPTVAYKLREWLIPLRDSSMWLVAALLAPAVVALVAKLAMPRMRMLIPARATVFLLVTMALGPGLAANVVTKEHWGRARPIDVRQMDGAETFVAWWDPRGDCPSNCSFVSGDVSAGIWTIAPAALLPPAWRPVGYAAAVAFAAGIGVMRMLFGAHFLSDVVFAGVITFLIVWLSYAVLYRWRSTRVSEQVMEQALARLARPGFLFQQRSAAKPHREQSITPRPSAPQPIRDAKRVSDDITL